MATSLQWVQSWNGSVLNWSESWGEGGGTIAVVATSSLAFGGLSLQSGEANFAPVGSITFLNSSYASSSFNLNGSLGGLFEGTTLKQPTALFVQAAGSFTFLSSVGSAFEIRDDQTTMRPFTAAVANSALVAASSAVAVWAGSDARDFNPFSIAATSNLALTGVQVAGVEFAAIGTATVTFISSPLYGADFTIAAATSATPWSAITLNPRGFLFAPAATVTFGPYSRASGAVGIVSTGFVEFAQTAGAVGQGAFSVAAAGSLAFTGNSKALGAVDIRSNLSAEFGQPGGGVEFGALALTHQLSLNFDAESIAAGNLRIAASEHSNFSSTNFVEEDDDLKKDADPGIFFRAAAEQEAWERDRRKLKKISRIDEDDLLVLAAALSQAVGQASRGVAAR